MSEEKKTETTENKKETTVDPIVEKAAESGWMPKEEWEAAGKDPAKWRDAASWNDRGELFSEIERLKKELSQTNKTLGSLKQHHLRVREAAYVEARKELSRELERAKKNEDFGKVLEIRDKMDEITKAEAQEKSIIVEEPAATQSVAPEFVEWQAKNSWYKINGKDAMSVYANNVAADFVEDAIKGQRQITNKEVYEFVDKRMREEFPDKFKNPARTNISKVESSSGERPSAKGGGPKLTDLEEKICRDLVKGGVITREQYLKDIGKYEENH